MACVHGGGITPGVMRNVIGGGSNQAYVNGTGLTAIQTLAVMNQVACAVIDISVNNGAYTLSSALAPFKFQWADVATIATASDDFTVYTITATFGKVTVTEDCVIPVYDLSASAWKDVPADTLVSGNDRLATIDYDSASDGDTLNVETITALTNTTTTDNRSIVTFTTADYFFVNIDAAKPAILVAGCQGSAVNDLGGGSLAGP